MKYPELIACIKKGALRPLYLIHGEEDYLIQEAVRLITEKAIDPGARDFNFNAVYARDMPGLELVNLCQTLPFISEMRLVIVKDLDAYKAADLEHMVPYLNDPSPSTCLVMLSNQGRFEKKAVTSAVEAHGVVTRVFQLRDNEIVNWVISKAKEKGLAIPADAAQLLWQIIGSDLQKLVNELEKIGIYLKDRKTVSFDDVKAVAGD